MVLETTIPSLAMYQAFCPSRSLTFSPGPATWAGFSSAGGPSAQAAPALSARPAPTAKIVQVRMRVPRVFCRRLAVQALVAAHDVLVNRARHAAHRARGREQRRLADQGRAL